MYWTAPDVTDARSYECGDVHPDWEFARQLRLNNRCWICGIPIVQAATYRLRLINVVSKQAKGRVRGGRPQEKVSLA
jgi:hypothetical protein